MLRPFRTPPPTRSFRLSGGTPSVRPLQFYGAMVEPAVGVENFQPLQTKPPQVWKFQTDEVALSFSSLCHPLCPLCALCAYVRDCFVFYLCLCICLCLCLLFLSFVFYCLLSTVYCQLSTVNCLLSLSFTVNCKLSTVNCLLLSTVNCQLSTANCLLSLSFTVNCQLSTVNCQLSTVNCLLLSTVYCQLSTVFYHALQAVSDKSELAGLYFLR